MNKLVLCLLVGMSLASCTLSFQNVDTHGSATDLIDENQTTTPNVSPDIDIPITPVPGTALT